MKMSGKFCPTHPSGEDIYLFTLSASNGTQVTISNYGAIITSFVWKRPGSIDNDIVLGFDRMEDYLSPLYLENYPWFGAAIGRYGNRIANATISVDGALYKLSNNRGPDQLHGGHVGFDKKVWNVQDAGDAFLVLGYRSADGEEGFPGILDVELRFDLVDDELSYQYHATCNKPTPVNLTHHSYFNLDNGKGRIFDHHLRIPADHYLQQNENLVTTGVLEPVHNTRYDFNIRRPIKSLPLSDGDYDQSFVLKDQGRQMKLAAEAWCPNSATRLEVWSTEPVVHFYSGKFIPVIQGKAGQLYGPYSAFCLETQVHPNAVNFPHFPDTILRPGQTYFQKTSYRLMHEQ
jgi:aldose 1-epimerase